MTTTEEHTKQLRLAAGEANRAAKNGDAEAALDALAAAERRLKEARDAARERRLAGGGE